MKLQEELNKVADKIENIVNFQAKGRNIGTSLQVDLEEVMATILPPEIQYYFGFNMSGQTWHVFFEKTNPANRIVL